MTVFLLPALTATLTIDEYSSALDDTALSVFNKRKEGLALLCLVQNKPQNQHNKTLSKKIEAICLKSELHWQWHIILLSSSFQSLPFFWPHYLLYTPLHLFYSHPLHLRSSLRLPVCYSLSS